MLTLSFTVLKWNINVFYFEALDEPWFGLPADTLRLQSLIQSNTGNLRVLDKTEQQRLRQRGERFVKTEH